MRNQPPEFANVVLDALTTHIAVLDRAGVIIGVNQPWRRFADLNAGETCGYCIGQNYLGACERAYRHGGEQTAQEMAEGLRAVLDHELEEFSLEYACHSPTGEQRWFVARVTACRLAGESRAVVAHENITARKTAELALERSDAELRRTKLEVEEINRELERALARERNAAQTDELTGVHNRRYFFSMAAQHFEVAHRYGSPLSLVMFDIDHFKRINDRHGHPAGDEILRRTARIVISHLRAADVFARYGGEEFVLLMPETRVAQARVVAERIRAAVSAHSDPSEIGQIRLTLSAGIAELGDSSDSLDRMIRRADQALYAAKAQGRNRSVLADIGASDGASRAAKIT